MSQLMLIERVCKKGYGQNGTKTQLRTRPQGISKITEQRKSKYIWFVIKTKDARSKGPTSRTKPWFISYLCIGGILGVLCNGLACKNSNVCDHFVFQWKRRSTPLELCQSVSDVTFRLFLAVVLESDDSAQHKPFSCFHLNLEVIGQDKSKPGLSCRDILDSGSSEGDGVYWIDPEKSGAPIRAYCDMTTAGGD